MGLFSIFQRNGSFRSKPQQGGKSSPFSLCQICNSKAPFLDSVDFNKSCEESRGRFLEPSGISINYYLCAECGFCFAPEFYEWSAEEFAKRIYNDTYRLVDPDFALVRPTANAEFIDQLLGESKGILRHLDYGGGSGLLSEKLRERGWNSHSYDPFVNPDVSIVDLGEFDLVTAFEVFEHVPNVEQLLANLRSVCRPKSVLIFSTLISDGNISVDESLKWWYAAPRNGHISLFSSTSLNRCMAEGGFIFGSFSANLHIAFRDIPEWASHLAPPRPPNS